MKKKIIKNKLKLIKHYLKDKWQKIFYKKENFLNIEEYKNKMAKIIANLIQFEVGKKHLKGIHIHF